MRSRFTVMLAVLLAAGAAPAAAQERAPAEPPGKLLVFPFLFYQPETRLGGGAALLRTFRAAGSTRASAVNLMLVATTRSQFSAIVQLERYGRGDRWRVAGDAGWSRFPDYFYGIGNATRLEDEELFTPESRRVFADVRRAVAPGLYLGAIGAVQHSTMRATTPGGMLEAGTITGSRGATLVAAGLVASLDRRDHLFTPTRGALVTAQVRRSAPALGSDLGYTRTEVDARAYRGVAGGVLASQAVVTTIGGDPPFFDLATIGGASLLRGYYEARYRDRNRVAGQIEFRRTVWRRLGVAAFGAAGQVARDPGDFRLKDLHGAGGAGLRLLVSRNDRVNARVDFGFGRGSSGVYFAFGEAF